LEPAAHPVPETENVACGVAEVIVTGTAFTKFAVTVCAFVIETVVELLVGEETGPVQPENT